MAQRRNGLKGNVADLRKLKQRLAKVPTTVVHAVAKESAPVLTDATGSAFKKQESVYGVPYPKGKDGSKLTLEKTGLTKRSLRFDASGTIVRCVLGPKYARYLIGKYKIIPIGVMPVTWTNRMQDIVNKLKVDV